LSAASSTRQMLERRRERRIPVHLPILVRGTDNAGDLFEERTSSENVCRGGVAFPVRHNLELGARVEISIPVEMPGEDPEAEFFTQGRVVHVMVGKSARELMIGVEFTGPGFQQVLAPESL
jgi:hypothetical protein